MTEEFINGFKDKGKRKYVSKERAEAIDKARVDGKGVKTINKFFSHFFLLPLLFLLQYKQ